MRFSFMKKETENHFQRSVNENKGKEPRGQRGAKNRKKN